MTSPVSIADFLEEAMLKHGEKPAFQTGPSRISFNELEQKSRQFAYYLQHDLGLTQGERVAIQLPNITQYPVVAYGALRAGMVVVNTNPLYTPREIAHQFNDSGAKVVVILSDLLPVLEKVLDQTGIHTVVTVEPSDLMVEPKPSANEAYLRLFDILAINQGCELPPRQIEDVNDTALLQYTGGTTGVAKGACLTHHSVLSNVRQTSVALRPVMKEGEDVFVCPLPLYHIYAFMINMVLMASKGALNVLIPNPRDLDAFVKQIKDVSFTGISGINTLFVGLCNHPEFKTLDFSGLKLTISGGTALIPDVARAWQSTTGCVITEGYGLTEASPVLTLNMPGQEEVGSIGQALEDTIIEIRDESGKSLPMGETGELVAKGPQLMKGYWQREDATRDTFTEDGFLRTGDVAVLQPNGNYRIVDRIKDMIIVSGFNVYPTEIESVLSTHPLVLEAAVVGHPSEKTGEEVVAYVTLSDDCKKEDLVSFCRENLTAYKVPKSIHILDALPKSTVGKILRRELRQSV